ncbi:hypothetical protein HBH70_206050 [Parastagonospora nodorum]|nr:hypothetical protein HBH51_206800 [Parastagonospora nodorum]KAH4044374.1 hypothetical protein HBH49_218400 [Parastagonospora nodorum]KAH4113799.1 hypothetical protein HBH47_204620 [Parastagonospora nodorum]KAH4216022.1 hypothetical protein HBI06_238010 [Parastagonospora nodorum]KAH4226590.1 hypothetical protein HBI05_217940 [Parastagonospora nodorum]
MTHCMHVQESLPDDFSEDCLTLNIWTSQSSRTDLPVIFWYYGSGFTQGGTKSLYYNPQSWVQRTQEHIVISVNVRANIFGFPNAPGLVEQNLGLLDQRLSLEWVRDNIASFGGDPSKVVAWGQSSGAVAVDYINFAYASDPIISGMILDSATAFYPTEVRQSADSAQSNFTAVAVALGCRSAPSQLDCLRKASWQDIASVLKEDVSLKFLPVVDERIVFSDYSRRYEEAGVSSIPAIIGTNQHEYNIGVPQPLGPNFTQTASDTITNITTLCTAAHASELRQGSSRRTYRYRYDGNFPNISPAGYPGAYHTAELPLIFGTDSKYHGPSTAEETAVGRTLQDLWLDFAKDPGYGLRHIGWLSYEEGKAVLLGHTDSHMREIGVSELDGVCSSLKDLP